ncbi:MAG TPA: hypothetical protein VH082_06605 [Rudaea sp.]|jgi:hypothetical protein|nr:hypothetical protein [Rudaea sp.]
MSSIFRLAIAFCVLIISVTTYAQDASSSDTTIANGQPVSPGMIDTAKPKLSMTQAEFAEQLKKWTTDQCVKGRIEAATDGTNFFLDGHTFAFDNFTNELVRRGKAERIYCVEIIGPGSDVKRVSGLLRKLKSTTKIETVSWKTK